MQGLPLARAWAATPPAIAGVGGEKDAELATGFWQAGGEALLGEAEGLLQSGPHPWVSKA